MARMFEWKESGTVPRTTINRAQTRNQSKSRFLLSNSRAAGGVVCIVHICRFVCFCVFCAVSNVHLARRGFGVLRCWYGGREA